MFTTLVAILCNTLSGPPLCIEEIVTDTAQSDLSFQECQVHGQIAVIEFMQASPRYRHDWKVESYKCAVGHYVVRGRA